MKLTPGSRWSRTPLAARDGVHDEDGGHDSFGLRPQDGRRILRDELLGVMQRGGLVEAWDDVSNKYLDYDMAMQARQAEMQYFKKMCVYTQVPRSEVKTRGGKIIGTRWIDVNKDDEKRPDYRSRLVGKEFRRGTDKTLYAATPPLEGLRAIISRAATYDPDHNHHSNEQPQRKHLMVNDVKRAYFYAQAKRDLFIEVPDEDPDKDPSMVGRLNLSLYGTRDAAQN